MTISPAQSRPAPHVEIVLRDDEQFIRGLAGLLLGLVDDESDRQLGADGERDHQGDNQHD